MLGAVATPVSGTYAPERFGPGGGETWDPSIAYVP